MRLADSPGKCNRCGAGRMVRKEQLDRYPVEEDEFYGELVWQAYKCMNCGYVEYEPMD